MLEGDEQSSQSATASRWRAQLLVIWLAHRRVLIIAGLLLALLLTMALAPAVLDRVVDALFAQRSVVIMLVLLGLLSLSLLWSAGQEVDAWIFLKINVRSYHPPILDKLMTAATQLGSAAAGFAVALGAVLAGNSRLAVEVILGVITLWLFVEVIKALADRSRPYRLFAETRIIGWRARGTSFPSGHTSQAFFMASLFAHYFQLGLGMSVVLYGLAALVGFTRMYVGAHYPRDVLGGVIAGWVWGTVGALVNQH
jgi:membrane-associated phospholipid phosphatase